MLSKEKMNRINELSKKSKNEGLTNQEQKEQEGLRKEYLSAFRGNMKKTLKNVKIVDPKGNDVTPRKLRNDQNFH
ncbi:DUF896 domain-containing protein [Bacillus carboniphilus]|uniref:UPF0291 protein LC087_04595 n=1 Tax=Bacillus carboniphilus TaxID=86663 RepID=A0ABY9JYD6_9BACI|nr:DUF896 domain-containing protein [Bacillus carboniphilus]WLR43455.1 DUF896 domain-containing protein [Bacillus carboniphilus]